MWFPGLSLLWEGRVQPSAWSGLEYGDLGSGQYPGDKQSLLHTRLVDRLSSAHPPIHVHTLPFLTFPPRTVSEHAMESLVGGRCRKSQHAVGTSNSEKQNKRLLPRALGSGLAAKMPSLNPACVSTMGMVTRSPKTWALALSLREEMQELAPNHALGETELEERP